MDNIRIHPSLARGAARMTLREAHRSFQERLERTIEFDHVSDERTARTLSNILWGIGQDRLVFMRTEYAKKHSSVLYFGLDVRMKDAAPELGGFVVISGKGDTKCNWLKYRISQHALERVQQRRIGMVQDVSAFADEFAPSFVASFVEGTQDPQDGSKNEERLLPTRTGALITAYDETWRGRIGVTWLATEQLRPEQCRERDVWAKGIAHVLSLLPLGKTRKTFSGRNDRVESRVRQSLAGDEQVRT